MFLSKMVDFPESLLLGITHCHWCIMIIKEFCHLHNAIKIEQVKEEETLFVNGMYNLHSVGAV